MTGLPRSRLTAPPQIWPAAAVGAMALLLYARSLLGGATFFLRDHLSMVVPAREFLGTSLRSGSFPQWWDAVGMGVPFAANPMHGCLYPLAWLSALAPGSLGADLVIVVHVLLLGLGVASLARRLGADASGSALAGAIAVASGYATSMAQNGVPLMTLAWLPWVACGADVLARAQPGRALIRATLKLAALLALAILSGDPAGAIGAGLLAALVLLVRSDRHWHRLLAFVAASVAALVLAAVVIVPALHLLGEGSRSGGIQASEAMSWSMHPLRILEWAWPQVLGDPTDPHLNLARAFANSSGDASMGPSWSLSVFLGLPVLALVALSRQRGLLLASLVFVLLALGSYTPLYPLYRTVFLPEQAIRFPERHLAGALILWAALAGVGWSQWRKASWRPNWDRVVKGGAGLLAVVAVVAFVAAGPIVDALDEGAALARVDAVAAWGVSQHGAVLAAVSALLFALASMLVRGTTHRRKACALAAAAVLLPLVIESVHVAPVVDRDLVSGTPALLQPVLGKTPSDGPRPRLYRNRLMNPRVGDESMPIVAAGLYHTAKPNMGAGSGIAFVPGYDPSLSSRLRALWDAGAGSGNRVLQLFDIEYVLLPENIAVGSRLPIVAPSLDPALVLARQPQRRPRAFVTTQWRWVGDDAEARAALFAPTADLNVVQLAGQGEPSPAGGALVPCVVESPNPNRVRLQCTTPQPGYAVLLDAWAPGWTATVDGTPTSIVRADSIVRAVAIPAGAHVVAFRYQTPGLATGLLLSGAGWLLWLLGFVALRFGQHESRPAQPEE